MNLKLLFTAGVFCLGTASFAGEGWNAYCGAKTALFTNKINKAMDSVIEILSQPGIDRNFILNLECTSLPSLEWNIPSIDTEAIPKSYKICIKPTSLSESNYSKLANDEGKPGIYILYSKPENGVSVNSIPIRRIFCRPKPFCKL